MSIEIPVNGGKKNINAILCDLDGVLTQTAQLHAQSWKVLFDEFLERHSWSVQRIFKKFDINKDYPAYALSS